MLLSICIPSYNRFENLSKAVQGLLKSTSNDFEIVVIDNVSPKEIRDYLTINDMRLRIVKRDTPVDGKQSVAECLRFANGDFAMLCLDKDTVEGQYIDDFLDVLAANTNICGGYCTQNKNEESVSVKIVQDDAILKFGYLNKHPSGDFYKNSILKEIFERITQEELIDAFSFDLYLSKCASKGPMMVYDKPLVFLEKMQDTLKTKSYSFHKENNTLFFFPDNRIAQFQRYLQHLDKLDLSESIKAKETMLIYNRTMLEATTGYKSIMKMKDICSHYRVEPVKVTFLEMMKHRNRLNKIFWNSKSIRISFYKKLVFWTEVNLKFWLRVINSEVRR